MSRLERIYQEFYELMQNNLPKYDFTFIVSFGNSSSSFSLPTNQFICFESTSPRTLPASSIFKRRQLNHIDENGPLDKRVLVLSLTIEDDSSSHLLWFDQCPFLMQTLLE